MLYVLSHTVFKENCALFLAECVFNVIFIIVFEGSFLSFFLSLFFLTVHDWYLRCLRVQHPGLLMVRQFTRLRWLNLYNTRTTRAVVDGVSEKCANLEYVDLGHCRDITGEDWDASIVSLARHCPQLKALDLWRARSLTHVLCDNVTIVFHRVARV